MFGPLREAGWRDTALRANFDRSDMLMQALFKDIMAIEGVLGVVLISLNGEVAYRQFHPGVEAPEPSPGWRRLLKALGGVDEADLVFANGRLYARRTAGGYLLVVAGSVVQSAMVRLHCDILLPELAKLGGKRKKRFFRR